MRGPARPPARPRHSRRPPPPLPSHTTHRLPAPHSARPPRCAAAAVALCIEGRGASLISPWEPSQSLWGVGGLAAVLSAAPKTRSSRFPSKPDARTTPLHWTAGLASCPPLPLPSQRVHCCRLHAQLAPPAAGMRAAPLSLFPPEHQSRRITRNPTLSVQPKHTPTQAGCLTSRQWGLVTNHGTPFKCLAASVQREA
jgi:hypothetical protein